MAKEFVIGIKDLHVGVLKSDESGFDNVTQIPGILEAKIAISEGTQTFYSDDMATDVINSLESVEVELNVSGISLEEQALILGERVENGSIASSINNMANRPYVGIAFRSEMSNGKYRYISIPKVKFSPTEFAAKGKEDSVERNATTLTGTAVPLNSGVYKVMADEGVATQSWLDTFLTTIPVEACKVAA